MARRPNPRAKVPTGIEGFDFVARGGIPGQRSTLVSGTSGSGKTIFGLQFLAEGIRQFDEPGVFLTFEESADDIRDNVGTLPWPIEEWEAADKWRFIDASLDPGAELLETGDFDFGALLARIQHAVTSIGAKRVVIDSVSASFSQFEDSTIVRRELHRVAGALKALRVTTLMTAERIEEYGVVARFGVEEFVADNVIILRNVLEDEKRRRTVEVLKFRGTVHQKGEFPFTITEDSGLVVIPLSAMELTMPSSQVRVSSGSAELDEMCGGGFFRDSVVLVSGATGTGKTLMVTEFVGAGAAADERSQIFAFEESRDQLFRSAHGWGVDFDAMEREGSLRVECAYPETAGLEDHLISIKRAIDEFQPHRLAIDSLSALERVSTPRGYREFVIGLTSFVKDRQIPSLFTSTTPALIGGTSVTEAHISTITDSIVLLRYVEVYGAVHRGITVLKMRGSGHDKDIREFIIDNEGMHIGQAFGNLTGILAGNPVQVEGTRPDPYRNMFSDDDVGQAEG